MWRSFAPMRMSIFVLSVEQVVGVAVSKMLSDELLALVVEALDDGKARDVRVIDVREKTSFTDYMVIASGTSERHVKSLADQVVEKAKEREIQPLGVEGQAAGEWVLVDLGDTVLHVMKPQVREFYQLEKFWQGDYGILSSRAAAVG